MGEGAGQRQEVTPAVGGQGSAWVWKWGWAGKIGQEWLAGQGWAGMYSDR